MGFLDALFSKSMPAIWPDDSKPGKFLFETRLENTNLNVLTNIGNGIAPVNIWVSPDPRTTMMFDLDRGGFLDKKSIKFDIVLIYPVADWSSKKYRNNKSPVGRLPSRYYDAIHNP